MVFRKIIQIKDKVFSRDDIIALWDFVLQQTKTQQAGEATITVTNSDQDVLSRTDDIFETSNFNKKEIKSIRVDYHSNGWTSKIEAMIAVEFSYLFPRSEVRITGESSEWVDSCAERVREILQDTKGTPWMTPVLHKGGTVVLCGGMGAAFGAAFSPFVVPLIKTITELLWVRFLFGIGYFILVGFLWWRMMKLDEYFPVVDIDIGGTHHLGRQRLAKIIWGLLSTIVLPVIIGLWISRT